MKYTNKIKESWHNTKKYQNINKIIGPQSLYYYYVPESNKQILLLGEYHNDYKECKNSNCIELINF